VDGSGSNLTKSIMVALMKCGGLTREDVAKRLLCFGGDGASIFHKGHKGHKGHKANKRCLGTFLNGCPLCCS